MPLVIGALAVGILSVFSLQSTVSNRLTDSGDAQVIAVNYQNDVQSAAMITTSNAPSNVPSTSSAATCGSGFQVMGLYFGNGNVVSYSAVAAGSGGTVNLFRNVCNGDTQTSSEVMANDVPSSMLTSGGDTLAGVILTANSTSITISSGGSFTGVSNGQYLSGENVVPGTYVLSGGGTPTLTLNQSPVATTITESVSFPPVAILCTTTGAACAPVATYQCARISERMGHDPRHHQGHTPDDGAREQLHIPIGRGPGRVLKLDELGSNYDPVDGVRLRNERPSVDLRTNVVLREFRALEHPDGSVLAA